MSSEHRDVHDSKVPDAVEDPGLQPEAAQSEEMSAYVLITYDYDDLLPVHLNFIKSKWLRSLRYGNPYFRAIEPDDFYHCHSDVLNERLESSTVKIAHLVDDKSIFLGFSVYDDDVLHYVYVYADQRLQGIATALIPKDTGTFTALTKTGETIWKNKYRNWRFNPYL